MDDSTKSALEAAITTLGEHSRDTVMLVYRLGRVDGRVEEMESALAKLQERVAA